VTVRLNRSHTEGNVVMRSAFSRNEMTLYTITRGDGHPEGSPGKPWLWMNGNAKISRTAPTDLASRCRSRKLQWLRGTLQMPRVGHCFGRRMLEISLVALCSTWRAVELGVQIIPLSLFGEGWCYDEAIVLNHYTSLAVDVSSTSIEHPSATHKSILFAQKRDLEA